MWQGGTGGQELKGQLTLRSGREAVNKVRDSVGMENEHPTPRPCCRSDTSPEAYTLRATIQLDFLPQ